MGWIKARFSWTAPPNQIRPGEVWPITSTATLLERVNTLNWSGSVGGNVWGQYLTTDDKGNGIEASWWVGNDGAGDPAGYTISLPATAKAGPGGKDMDLNMSSFCSKNFKVIYHYKWNP